MKRYVFGFLVFSVLTALLLAGCGGGVPSGSSTPGAGGGGAGALEVAARENIALYTVLVPAMGLSAKVGQIPDGSLGLDPITYAIYDLLGATFPDSNNPTCQVSVRNDGDQDNDGVAQYRYGFSCQHDLGGFQHELQADMIYGDLDDANQDTTGFGLNWDYEPGSIDTPPFFKTGVDGGKLVGEFVPNLSLNDSSYGIGLGIFPLAHVAFADENDEVQWVAGIRFVRPSNAPPYPAFTFEPDSAQDPMAGGRLIPASGSILEWALGLGTDGAVYTPVGLEATETGAPHWSASCASNSTTFGLDSGGFRIVGEDGTVYATVSFDGCGQYSVEIP